MSRSSGSLGAGFAFGITNTGHSSGSFWNGFIFPRSRLSAFRWLDFICGRLLRHSGFWYGPWGVRLCSYPACPLNLPVVITKDPAFSPTIIDILNPIRNDFPCLDPDRLS